MTGSVWVGVGGGTRLPPRPKTHAMLVLPCVLSCLGQVPGRWSLGLSGSLPLWPAPEPALNRIFCVTWFTRLALPLPGDFVLFSFTFP